MEEGWFGGEVSGVLNFLSVRGAEIMEKAAWFVYFPCILY